MVEFRTGKRRSKKSAPSKRKSPVGRNTDDPKSPVAKVIDIRQWRKSGWKGVSATRLDSHPYPVLGLRFKDIRTAKSIFKHWRYYFGEDDPKESIRISVIRGIDKNNPLNYIFHITQRPNPYDIAKLYRDTLSFNPSLNSFSALMTPDSPDLLDALVNNFGGTGDYTVAPEISNSDDSIPLVAQGIRKREFHVTDAWQVHSRHEDAWAVSDPENVLVPEGVSSPPINTLITLKKRFHADFLKNIG